MRVAYLDRNFLPQDIEERLKFLHNLFAQLLIHTDGDADEALDLMQRLGERHGLFDNELSFEDFKQLLEKQKIVVVDPNGGGAQLSPKGERFVRQRTLDQIFSGLKQGLLGKHRMPRVGQGSERLEETRPWQYGDDLHHIDFMRSFHNAFRRGVSSSLREEDLEVFDTEHDTSVATALLLDISHSMILYGEDRITPAKRVALALAELIQTKYPKDALHIILFGDVATEVPLKQLTYAGVGPYHTNTHMALQMARNLLVRKKQANKQIFMITDGKPTALLEGDELYINSGGMDPRIINKTLSEGAECRRHGIPITTFMIARDQWLVKFVEDLTRINKGRAFYAGVDGLEQSVFVDFVTNRRKKGR